MDSLAKKRQRCASFSSDEKLFISHICAKYKDILENKKTDDTTSEQKKKTWEKICSEVNTAANNGIYRSADVLRRFYENRKREVRKLAAEKRKEIYLTGGGQCSQLRRGSCHDIILSVMNSKSVYGLQNDFDGDAEPHQSSPDLQSSEADLNSQVNNDLERVYESGTIDNEQDSKWKKYTPANLKIPITPALTNFNKPSTSKIQNDEDIHITTTPDSHKWKLSSSRRRPTLHVKALTRSELAEKYDKLIDKRLEIAEKQKQKLEEELATIKGERNLKFNLLELQIEVEKEKLKQLKK